MVAFNNVLHKIWNLPYWSHGVLTHKTASLQSIYNLVHIRSIDTVETEFHFVMLCPALEHLRSTFFNCLSDLDISFTSLTPIDKFMYILSANSHCKIIGKHLYNMYKTRTQLLNL